MAKKVEVKTGTEEQINGVNPVTTENAEVGQKPENAENNASVNLKNTILERNVRIQNIHDLIKVLEDIVAEDE